MSAPTDGCTARSTFAAVTLFVWKATASSGTSAETASLNAGTSFAPRLRRTISPQYCTEASGKRFENAGLMTICGVSKPSSTTIESGVTPIPATVRSTR